MGRIFYLNESDSHITKRDLYNFFMSHINNGYLAYEIGEADVWNDKNDHGYRGHKDKFYRDIIYYDKKHNRYYGVYINIYTQEVADCYELRKLTQKDFEEDEFGLIPEGCEYKIVETGIKGTFLSFADAYFALDLDYDTFVDMVFAYVEEQNLGVTFDEYSLDNFLEALNMAGLDYCLEDEHGNRILLYDFDEFA